MKQWGIARGIQQLFVQRLNFPQEVHQLHQYLDVKVSGYIGDGGECDGSNGDGGDDGDDCPNDDAEWSR